MTFSVVYGGSGFFIAVNFVLNKTEMAAENCCEIYPKIIIFVL